MNPTSANLGDSIAENARTAAQALGLQIHVLSASTDEELNTAFATLPQLEVGALVVGGDAFFLSRRGRIVALAARYAVPTIYNARDYPAIGGLMSYGGSLSEAYRLCGIYTGKILKGAQPGDLPVLQPAKFELVMNLATAKALGLTVPLTLEASADEMIE